MRRALCTGTSLLLATALGCSGSSPAEEASSPDSQETGWERLPDPPLSPRMGAATAWTGSEIVVFGGSDFMCSPTAGCSGGAEAQDFRDGAAYDATTRTWRSIATAPAPVRDRQPVVVNGDIYVQASCTPQPCERHDAEELLRYDPEQDTWTTLPPPHDEGYHLTPTGDNVLAFSIGKHPDWLLDAGTDTWERLPDAPLPPTDRQVVPVGEDLMLFAKEAGSQSRMLSARFDAETGTWERPLDTPASGYQAWLVDGIVVIDPRFEDDEGGVFDPATAQWSPLPDPPAKESWQNNMAGVLGQDSATFAAASGWVLDMTSETWIEIPQLDEDERERLQVSPTSVGRDLFLFGGERWTEPGGELLADAWLWTAPPAAADG